MEIDYKDIKVIGFDADDTLWVNETYFRDAESEFAQLLGAYETINTVDQLLFKKEIENLQLYGYGVKGFVLSMIESAIEISNGAISIHAVEKILNIGKQMINKPVEVLDGVEDVLKILSEKYKLILATKGDLLDQERKIEQSGLAKYFKYIEVLSDKKEANYSQLLQHLDVSPEQFLMVGNSLRSDILPLVNIKANAIHIPFHTTWMHEYVNEADVKGKSYKTVRNIKELTELL
ncbi:MAG: HAD family hydrolase [Flavobacteriaceae bacterium]|nr:HAD family hydrolase [Flavobacteriaceae bacterium]